MGDDDVLVVALARLLEGGGQRLGVRHRVGQLEGGVEVVVDADHQHVQARRRRRLGAGPGDLGARRDRGDEVGAVVGDELDGVLAGVERHRLLQGDRPPCGRSRLFHHADGDAVDAPLGATDAAALVGEPRLHGDKIDGEIVLDLVRGDGDAGHAAAVEQLGEVELGGGVLHLAVGIAGELLAHQVGAVEDLVELVDAEDLEAADDGQHVRALGRSVEEALRRHGEPFAALRSRSRLASSSPVRRSKFDASRRSCPR